MIRIKAPSSIRWRLYAILVAPLVLLTVAGGYLDYIASIAPGRTAYDQSLGDNAFALAARLKIDGGRVNVDLPPEAEAFLRTDRYDTIYFSVFDSVGQLLAGDKELKTSSASASNPSFEDGQIDGHTVRIASYRINSKQHPPVTINVAETMNKREKAKQLVRTTSLLVDFFQFDVTLLLIWIAIYLALRPLRKLGRAIEERSPRAMEQFDQSAVPTEVRPLTAALNRLFSVLTESNRVQRQFVADSAHQLRTPLTTLLGQLEALILEPGLEKFERRFSTLHESALSIARSANQLLTLARTDPSVLLSEVFETVDLEELIHQVIGRFIDRSVQLKLDIGAEIQSVSVNGNTRLLDDLLSNLIDNALNYTPAGGHVTVRVGYINDVPHLEVEDDGPGIPEAERPFVQRRFYRIPGSPGNGSGLGLAIVDDIARLHGATVTIDSGQNGRGTRVCVQFKKMQVLHV